MSAEAIQRADMGRGPSRPDCHTDTADPRVDWAWDRGAACAQHMTPDLSRRISAIVDCYGCARGQRARDISARIVQSAEPTRRETVGRGVRGDVASASISGPLVSETAVSGVGVALEETGHSAGSVWVPRAGDTVAYNGVVEPLTVAYNCDAEDTTVDLLRPRDGALFSNVHISQCRCRRVTA